MSPQDPPDSREAHSKTIEQLHKQHQAELDKKNAIIAEKDAIIAKSHEEIKELRSELVETEDNLIVLRRVTMATIELAKLSPTGTLSAADAVGTWLLEGLVEKKQQIWPGPWFPEAHRILTAHYASQANITQPTVTETRNAPDHSERPADNLAPAKSLTPPPNITQPTDTKKRIDGGLPEADKRAHFRDREEYPRSLQEFDEMMENNAKGNLQQPEDDREDFVGLDEYGTYWMGEDGWYQWYLKNGQQKIHRDENGQVHLTMKGQGF